LNMAIDTSRMENEIKELNPKEEELRNNMEGICKEFMEATEVFLGKWYEETVQRAIADNPDTITKASEGGTLSTIKNELEALTAQIPQIVNKELNLDSLWMHREQFPALKDRGSSSNELEYRYGLKDSRALPDFLSKAIRKMTSPLGILLVKHKLDRSQNGDEWEQGAQDMEYRYGISHSNEMITISGRYAEAYGELFKVDFRIKTLEKEIIEAKAKNLWEQA